MTDTDSLAQTVRRYRREIASALIAVKWHLDTPYPDSPEWTPWTRFVERALRKVDEIPALVDELVGRLDQAERERDFLRLELEAARHNWKKDNEFLLARAEKEECGRIVRTQPEGGAG